MLKPIYEQISRYDDYFRVVCNVAGSSGAAADAGSTGIAVRSLCRVTTPPAMLASRLVMNFSVTRVRFTTCTQEVAVGYREYVVSMSNRKVVAVVVLVVMVVVLVVQWQQQLVAHKQPDIVVTMHTQQQKKWLRKHIQQYNIHYPIVHVYLYVPVFCQSAPGPPQYTPAGAPYSSRASPIRNSRSSSSNRNNY